MMRRMATAALAGAALATAAAPALADAIDGDWCSPDEKQYMEIHGPEILTPGGNKTRGNYTRHAFNYVVPASEKSAGQTINMLLLNEEQVQLFQPSGAPGDIWHRCKQRPIS